MSVMLAAARSYVAAGLSVIPLDHGSKHPSASALEQTVPGAVHWAPQDPRSPWREYTRRMPTDAELVTWFAATNHQIGIVGGAISGGLIRIDFEHPLAFQAWVRALSDIQGMGLLSLFIEMLYPVVQTPKGCHVYFRMPEPPGHELLCSNGEGSSILVLAETQGEGCYCVAPPSQVSLADGVLYVYRFQFNVTTLEHIPVLSQDAGQRLLDAARFPDLWTFPLSPDDDYGRSLTLTAHRTGVTVGEQWHDHYRSVPIQWHEVTTLRRYFERYGPLLDAIAAAPPPPPSYTDYGDPDYEDLSSEETWDDI